MERAKLAMVAGGLLVVFGVAAKLAVVFQAMIHTAGIHGGTL